MTIALLSALDPQVSKLHAQGTAFTYQGRLNNDAAPANGNYDLRFKLFLDPLANNQAGSTLLSNSVPVSNGLFTITLDFGPGIFNGTNYWLDIGVKTNGAASYADLSPLQALTPVPYAVFAENAVSGGLAGGTYTNAVILNNPSNSFSGSFTGNGGGLTNVNAATLGGLSAANFWKTIGNSGTIPGTNFVGTTDTQPLELWVNQARALRLEPGINTNSIIGAPNVIGGAPNNYVDPGIIGGTIAGGGAVNMTGYLPGPSSNHVGAIFGTIGGGRLNTVWADHATIAGGITNNIATLAWDSAIGGGRFNAITMGSQESVIAGGEFNTAAARDATIGGGDYNNVNAQYGTISGGAVNSMQTAAAYSTIAGGYQNTIQAVMFNNNLGGYNSTIVGGLGNTIGSPYVTIGGGSYHSIGTNSNSGFIGGGYYNRIADNTFDSTISGGSYSSIGTNSLASTISGGTGNSIGDNAFSSAISGGYNNSVQSYAAYSFLGGGLYNSIQTFDSYSVLGGGYGNSVGSYAGTIAGGYNNSIQYNVSFGFIGGGNGNSIAPGSGYSAIGGGLTNIIQTNSGYAVLAGGYFNSIGTNSYYASLGGGASNSCAGMASTIPGGYSNSAAGSYSFAAGNQAQANNDGTFVWADAQNATFGSTSPNQFLIRASGGVAINTNNPAGAALNVAGTVKANAFQGDGSGLSNINVGALQNYAFGYYNGTQVVLTGNVFQDINLNTDAQLNGWTHTPGTPQYTNAQTGIYLVQYQADVATTLGNGTNATLRATLNSIEIPGTRVALTFSALNQLIPASRSFLASFNASDVLTLQFTGSGSGIRVTGSPGVALTITRIQ